jgi:hypothetical protein
MLSLLLATALGLAPSNVLCPVTGRQVSNHALYHHVTVRGQRYYVFDREAATRLKTCPGCYLARDGRPLNEANLPELESRPAH